jgi:hypothetical protein
MQEGLAGLYEIDESDHELPFAVKLTREQFTTIIDIGARVVELVPSLEDDSDWLLADIKDALAADSANPLTVSVPGFTLIQLQTLLHLANDLRGMCLDEDNEFWQAFGLCKLLREVEAAGPVEAAE